MLHDCSDSHKASQCLARGVKLSVQRVSNVSFCIVRGNDDDDDTIGLKMGSRHMILRRSPVYVVPYSRIHHIRHGLCIAQRTTNCKSEWVARACRYCCMFASMTISLRLKLEMLAPHAHC